MRGALAGLQRFAVFRRATLAVQRGLRLREHDGNRRAKFMRGIGRELFLLRESGFQPRKGGIQNRGQPAQLAFGLGHVDALRQVAGGDFHGSGADIFNRTQRVRDQPPASREAEQQDQAADASKSQGHNAKLFQLRDDGTANQNLFARR